MKNVPGYRHDRRSGQYVPTVNGIDLPVTTFSETRAMELAQEAADAMPVKYTSKSQPNVKFWAEEDTIIPGSWIVVAQAEGYPATAAHGDHFHKQEDADQVAQQLANQ
jgi:hypothetical protein